jgi:pantetheine-phosphate adenylyltransferase
MKSSSKRAKRQSIGNCNMNRVALFPGSFDPFTAGHLNILKRALTMFDEVVIAVGINHDKRGFFTMDQRLDIIKQATVGIEGVKMIQYDKLTVDICRELGIKHMVRGVRNMIDFETERSIADANRILAPDIETIIIPTSQEFAHISSSAVRDIIRHHGDTSLFIPSGVKLPEA